MGNGLIAFLIGLGAGTWVYNFFMKHTGNQIKPAAIVGGIVGVIIMIIVYIIASIVSG